MARKTQKKTGKQLDYEIELFRHVRHGDKNPRLVVMDDDGGIQGTPTKAQLREFGDYGTVDGRHDLGIGIGFEDRRGNDVAISITRKEAQAFIKLM